MVALSYFLGPPRFEEERKQREELFYKIQKTWRKKLSLIAS
jgi:hypothetical protein